MVAYEVACEGAANDSRVMVMCMNERSVYICHV